MKKCFAMFLCFCMLLSMLPVFAGGSENTTATVCKVLFEENFEDGATDITISGGATVAGVVQDVAETDAYGQGVKNYGVTNANSSPYGQIVFDPANKLTASLRGGAHTEEDDTYGYTVEVSADWNPNDYNASNPTTRLGLSGRETKDEGFQVGQFMYLMYTGGDAETSGRTISIMDRSQTTVDTVDLTQVLGDEIWDTAHVYRVRFVIKPYTEVKIIEEKKYSGEIDVYMDGVKIYTFQYQDNTKESIVYGFYYRTNKTHVGTLDNIKVIAYWDAMTAETEGAVSYLNDDALITAIRRCEYELTGLDEAKQNVLKAAIASAKTAYEATDRTQTTIDAATVALEAAESDVYKVYQYDTLYQEDYEGDYTSFESYQYTYSEENPTDTDNTSAVATVDSTSDQFYALGSKWYQLETADKYGLVHRFGVSSGNIRNDATNIANNYKAEVSLDYKMPEDIVSRILVQTNQSNGNYNKGGKICLLEMKPSTGSAVLYDRNDKTIATFNMADFASGANFIEEVNRFRFVFETEEAGSITYDKEYTTAGTISLYINGSKACEGKYINNTKEQFIAGLTIKSATDNAGKPLGFVDNIEMIDYDDTTLAASNSVAYINRDKLVAAIRGAASIKEKAEAIDGVTLPTDFETNFAAAKTAYETATTTAAMDAAAETLTAPLADVKTVIRNQELVKDFSWIPDVAAENEKQKAQNSIYGDLYLPSTYLAGSRDLDITWESDKPGVIDATGAITGPLTNTYVNLTAIFTDGTDNTIHAEKSFKTRVLAGGDVLLNETFAAKDKTSNNTFKPTMKKFMVSVSGKAGDYTFTLGGQNVAYTFATDGDYDVIFDTTKNTYTVYENCGLVHTDAVSLGTVEKVTVSGNAMTQIIGIDLDMDKAFVASVNYNDGTYDIGVPTPGGKLTSVTLKTRDAVENAVLYAVVYTGDGMLYDVATASVTEAGGQTVPVTFTKEIVLPTGDAFENASVKLLLWDAQLAPIMQPVLYDTLGDLYEERATVYMIGDSTMCNYSAYYYPRAGWGQMLGNYFDDTQVVVDNRAVSGRTTKWFKEKGEFDKILSTIKPGDYLIMQFGHNDQKPAANISIADFQANLKYFAESVKAKGATPIIASSITRRTYNATTGLYDSTIGSLEGYPAAALEVATELGITGLDLYDYSKTVLSGLTETTSRQLYCFVPNDFPGYDASKLVKYVDGIEDNTHFSEYGANIWAKEAARLIGATGLSISGYVKNVD